MSPSGRILRADMDNGAVRPSRLLAIASFALVTTLLVAGARRWIPPENICPDFIQFWTAATAVTSGEDPYSPAFQTRVQGELGWATDSGGLGVYAFLPYYYPPWLAWPFTLLLPFGYPLAKLVWLVVGAEMLLAAGAILGAVVPGITPAFAMTVVATFGFSIKAVAMGQVAPLVLLLVGLSWWLLDRRRDAAAGVVLALLTVKPQLGLLLVGAVLLWCARRSRWTVPFAFAATMLALAGAATMLRPDWLASMLAATRVTPMPTAYYPGLGTTWLVTLGAVGVGGHALHLAYVAVVIPMLLALLRLAARGGRLDEIYGLALLAPFFVAPYARHYDFPVLLVPALVLAGTRLSALSRMMLVASLVVLGSLHLVWLAANYEAPQVGSLRPEYTFFWVPLLIGAAWLATSGKARSEETPEAARRPELQPPAAAGR